METKKKTTVAKAKVVKQIKKQTKHHQFKGRVVSETENKTIHVLVVSIKMHPKYKKQYTTNKKYAVHDEKNEAHVGDLVSFIECRPLSKTKKWRSVSILKAEKAE